MDRQRPRDQLGVRHPKMEWISVHVIRLWGSRDPCESSGCRVFVVASCSCMGDVEKRTGSTW